ncbi:MAG: DDE-type integrase/transposase/recombinase [Nitrososphaeraceae archaeon]
MFSVSLFPWSFIKKYFQSHTAIRDWIQKYKHEILGSKKIRITEFIIDETIIKVGSEYIWLWIAIENDNREILQISISKERNMFVAEHFIQSLIRKYGEHPISTDGGTWYPQACKFLKIKHNLHSAFEKSIIERTIQYIKDRTECFDDYFPCRKNKCKLQHIQRWLNLFVSHHNKGLVS